MFVLLTNQSFDGVPLKPTLLNLLGEAGATIQMSTTYHARAPTAAPSSSILLFIYNCYLALTATYSNESYLAQYQTLLKP